MAHIHSHVDMSTLEVIYIVILPAGIQNLQLSKTCPGAFLG